MECTVNYKVTDEVPYSDPHSRGTGSIVTQRKGYILRTRGEHNRLVRHDYRCPVHGVFEAMVPSGEVPAEMSCQKRSEPRMFDLFGATGQEIERIKELYVCGKPSPWQTPTVAQGWAAGSVKT